MDGNDVEVSGVLYEVIQALSDQDLDRFSVLLIVLSFGQSTLDSLDTEQSLFNRVAVDLKLGMREWWVPDAEVLALMRKDQLEAVAAESGAGKLKGCSKKELVTTLARYFERTADPKAKLKDQELKGRAWLPGAMMFPADLEISASDKT